MLVIASLVFCHTAACVAGTYAFVFQSVSDMLKWKNHSRFTNGIEMIYWNEKVQYLPTNFMANLANEITGQSFNALIMQQHKDMLGPEGKTDFEVAICGGDQMGFVLRANCSMGAEDSPPWMRRLKFYLSSRFNGHTAEYVIQALEEQSSGTNITLPFGFPRAIQKEYWIPSKRIQEDTLELDSIDLGMPQDKGLIKMNRLWLVLDGQFAWIYWFDVGEPFSQRRDPQEYDPKYKTQFDSAVREALKTIEKRKILTDIRIPLDEEVQRILEQKYGVKWTTPEQLN